MKQRIGKTLLAAVQHLDFIEEPAFWGAVVVAVICVGMLLHP